MLSYRFLIFRFQQPHRWKERENHDFFRNIFVELLLLKFRFFWVQMRIVVVLLRSLFVKTFQFGAAFMQALVCRLCLADCLVMRLNNAFVYLRLWVYHLLFSASSSSCKTFFSSFLLRGRWNFFLLVRLRIDSLHSIHYFVLLLYLMSQQNKTRKQTGVAL